MDEMESGYGNVGLIMKLLLSLFLLISLSAFGAVPSYTAFIGTNGITVSSNPPQGKILISGSGIAGTAAGDTFNVQFNTNDTFAANAGISIYPYNTFSEFGGPYFIVRDESGGTNFMDARGFGTISTNKLTLSVNSIPLWYLMPEGHLVPVSGRSNANDVGSFLLPARTNWVNDMIAKETVVVNGGNSGTLGLNVGGLALVVTNGNSYTMGSFGIGLMPMSAYKLDVLTTSAGTWIPDTLLPTMRIINNSATANSFAGIEMDVNWSDATQGGVKMGVVSSAAYSGDLVIANRNGGFYQENLRVKYNGNVGINTTAPANKLDVVGGIHAVSLVVTSSLTSATVQANTTLVLPGLAPNALLYNDSGTEVAVATLTGGHNLATGVLGHTNLVLTVTTNQIVFGATNIAPPSVAAPTKWISVKVTGEAGTYFLPLYQ